MQYNQWFIGYHGCDYDVACDLVNLKSEFKPSDNKYDWLGPGIYFWENDPLRAYEFARDIKKYNKPCVVGALLHLGKCLDLTCRQDEILLNDAYESFIRQSLDVKLANKKGKYEENNELILRYLDCAIITEFNNFIETQTDSAPYDSVRAAFWEGKELAKESFFLEKNHIQLCIRNPKCIKGVFFSKDNIEDILG